MKDRNGPATIARCKETGKCQFIDVINSGVPIIGNID